MLGAFRTKVVSSHLRNKYNVKILIICPTYWKLQVRMCQKNSVAKSVLNCCSGVGHPAEGNTGEAELVADNVGQWRKILAMKCSEGWPVRLSPRW